jgi:hypothetical protein
VLRIPSTTVSMGSDLEMQTLAPASRNSALCFACSSLVNTTMRIDGLADRMPFTALTPPPA